MPTRHMIYAYKGNECFSVRACFAREVEGVSADMAALPGVTRVKVTPAKGAAA